MRHCGVEFAEDFCAAGCGKALGPQNRSGYCVSCRRKNPAYQAWQKQYRAERAEHLSATERVWRETNVERKKANDAAWYRANKQKAGERAKQRRETNRQHTHRYAKKYRDANKAVCSARTQEWARRNPARRKATYQKYRAAKFAAGGSFSFVEWFGLLNRYQHTCPRCGCRDKALTADHVVPVSLGGPSNIENIQPLCGPCNSAKGTKVERFDPWNG